MKNVKNSWTFKVWLTMCAFSIQLFTYRLCSEGYDVILACRNEEKGRAAVQTIKHTQPDALASTMKVR